MEDQTGSIPVLGIEYGGQSNGVTPEPIPNSEDKPVHVLHCTQVREPSGTADRCHIHLTLFCSFNMELGLPNYYYFTSKLARYHSSPIDRAA